MSTGGVELDDVTFATDAFGYRKMLAWANKRTADPSRRCWAIEGTGSFGSGLTTYLLEQGEWVVEIDRPKRPARRNGAKFDVLDAYREPARHWPVRTWLNRDDEASTRRSVSFYAPGKVPFVLGPEPCATSRLSS